MFLSCGDALFDIFVDSEANQNTVALSGGVGGSPLNVAIGLCRLGHHSRFLTKVSSDPFGQRMSRHLAENKLDTSLCIDTDQNTTLAIVEKNPDGSAKYVFYLDNTADASITADDIPAQLPDDIKVLHVGSYSTVLPQTGAALQGLVQREAQHRAISYDPNLRLMVQPDIAVWKAAFDHISQYAFVIKASDEDVDAFMGEGNHKAFLELCLERGAQAAFITRGPNGAMAMDSSGQFVDVPGVSVVVEDTVGAGDTFQAAILHWLTSNQHVGENVNGRTTLSGSLNLSDCVQFALQAAAITCTRRGADLPTLADVESALSEANKS